MARYGRNGLIIKGSMDKIDHNEVQEKAKAAYTKAHAKSKDSYHAHTEAKIAAEDAGANASEARAHADMARTACGGGY